MINPIEIVPNVFLNHLDSSYSEDYFALLNHPKISPFIPHQCIPACPSAAARELITLYKHQQNGTGAYWGIYCDNTLIGTCGLHTFSPINRTVEVSYEVHPNFWNRGIATNAVIQLVAQAPLFFPIDRILCFTLVDNLPSQKVALKSGFYLLECRHQDCQFNGKLVDRYLFVKDL